MNGDGEEGTHWQLLADKHWLRKSKKPSKFNTGLVRKELWDALEERNFDYSSLLALEGLQLLEKYVAFQLAKCPKLTVFAVIFGLLTMKTLSTIMFS